eukprot:464321-Rhodomonas_salina.1
MLPRELGKRAATAPRHVIAFLPQLAVGSACVPGPTAPKVSTRASTVPTRRTRATTRDKESNSQSSFFPDTQDQVLLVSGPAACMLATANVAVVQSVATDRP